MEWSLEAFQDQWDKWLLQADPRVAEWPLMSSPLPTIFLVTSYVIVILILKAYMKDRAPLNIKPFIIVYNFFLVALSAYMVVEMVRTAYFIAGYGLICNNMSYSPELVDLAKVLYVFYISKFIEFIDTITMVLRKQNDKVSFLHMYHHVSMPLLWWVGIKWVAGGDSLWTALLNSFVHVLMYLHYLVSALGVGNLWWKPYLTQLQMGQFFFNLLLCLSAELPYEYGGCDPATYTFPFYIRRALVAYMLSLLVLFGNFYVHAYLMGERLPRRGPATNGVPDKKTK